MFKRAENHPWMTTHWDEDPIVMTRAMAHATNKALRDAAISDPLLRNPYTRMQHHTGVLDEPYATFARHLHDHEDRRHPYAKYLQMPYGYMRETPHDGYGPHWHDDRDVGSFSPKVWYMGSIKCDKIQFEPLTTAVSELEQWTHARNEWMRRAELLYRLHAFVTESYYAFTRTHLALERGDEPELASMTHPGAIAATMAYARHALHRIDDNRDSDRATIARHNRSGRAIGARTARAQPRSKSNEDAPKQPPTCAWRYSPRRSPSSTPRRSRPGSRRN